MRLQDIAERLGCRLEGDGSVEIRRVAGIEQAELGDLTFLANQKYRSWLSATRASAVILGNSSAEHSVPCAVLRADDPYLAYAGAVSLLASPVPPPVGIDPLSAVAADAALGSAVSIGAFASIGAGASIGHRTVIYPNAVVGPDARVGDDCIIRANVSIRERVVLGNRVHVQDGAVIGSDGFGFAHRSDGTHVKIPHHADVVIEDDVEIGANTTIDRPAVGETRIRAGAKIDNLVQIAHGVTIGRHSLVAAQVGIAGSTNVGDRVMFAGQVGVAGHLQIGDGVVATAQTGIPNSIEPGGFVSGYPAIPNREWLKASAVFRQLPALKKRVVELERLVAELERKLAGCRSSSET